MDKRSLENQEQLAAGFMRISRYYKLEISIQTLLVAHVKTIALGTKDRFRVSTEDEAAFSLRECDIEMWAEPAADRSKLLSHKRGHIDLRLARSGIFASW